MSIRSRAPPSSSLSKSGLSSHSSLTQRRLKKKLAKSSTVFNAWWIVGLGVVSGHVLFALSFLFYTPVPTIYIQLGALYGFLGMLGITAGWHRLWTHQAFQASVPVRVLLALFGTLTWQGSIKWWVLRHRIHHRFTDTEHDPYDITRGFWFAHMGWLLKKPEYMTKAPAINMKDINADPVARVANQLYPAGVIVLGLLLPALTGWYLGDVVAGFLWIGNFGRIISWNGIFFVNSWAHYMGSKPYNREISATQGLFLALISNGEGNHNFHHAFPKDYRHGYRCSDYDPTKWLISLLSYCGATWDLHRTDAHLVRQAELQNQMEDATLLLHHRKQLLAEHMASAPRNFRTPNLTSLPLWTEQEFRAHAKAAKEEGRVLCLLDGQVLDLTSFKDSGRHPGGDALLLAHAGMDIARVFHGGLNKHSQGAINLSQRYRIARMDPHSLPASKANKSTITRESITQDKQQPSSCPAPSASTIVFTATKIPGSRRVPTQPIKGGDYDSAPTSGGRGQSALTKAVSSVEGTGCGAHEKSREGGGFVPGGGGA